MNNSVNMTDVGFIHDVGGLDKLRKSAVSGDQESQDKALRAAAEQFESIFTQMLFKSMRNANDSFKSDMMSSDNQQFFEQMRDDQMATELSKKGSLGLADMIVAQLSASMNQEPPVHNGKNLEQDARMAMRKAATDETLRLPVDYQYPAMSEAKKASQTESGSVAQLEKALAVRPAQQPQKFDSPQQFVETMKPYAEKAAKALGIDSNVLIAQAALETGWGKKVIQNSVDSSHNLFNIKADRSWQGDKIAKNTLEYHDNIAVTENAAFRSYDNYEESFSDFVRFLNQNPRYERALQQTESSESFIKGIHSAGYATDPNYTDKVMSVMKTVESLTK
ncbi:MULTISPECIES: flagellar assembly peptidoglycan hydrolase FlgJ [Aliivibrio]|uniref:Peptidoglycan hydrolase FlgJ n=1 Tax=Aliivibrio finisterrensis TaxID=511998 RepID=A0A4Q5KR88_9GAMM|nr:MULTISPECIES: flagellar assembly peptidoglycan hydrolase FlgJ [Aliivibrio]MDD9180184.1 flagellar assembly peptidoglycan hydrolase FlgJ [Aliivibrio sp. A6]RYU48505.1 flagellar assembly peptidoglycan hydrolase FlgJ [Aliivibrio finisterrensis]RYU49473.1 flagellar assembly peptidoglycan hydrolase FlgJ [Aliivibrio finisterrensis]RYU49908.1 flagellar assembly peptidoglycan hydrolase FlgJ [Aliivibrio finisterrensis]RYU55664.1 flagellar assembly peptidoglycan hydrolase FlgJ [Aliivibrio finisterrens